MKAIVFAALTAVMLGISGLLQAEEPAPGSVIFTAPDSRWTIRTLGKDVYVFRWAPDFYQSLFVVGPNEVLVVDPIGHVAAKEYREAIKRVTNAPVTKIVYSHSDRDHIAGATELSANAEIFAQENTKKKIIARGDKDIPVPTRVVADGDVIKVGDHRIQVHYFGPSHTDSLIALTLDTGMGRLLMFVDAIEPGIPPYRNMGDFDVRGYMVALDKAVGLNVDAVMGGHTGPLPGTWVTMYRNYISDLLAATQEVWATMDTSPKPGEDGIHSNERIIAETTKAAANRIRDKYGTWRGYDVWAPMNAERMLVYIQTGN